MGQGYECEIEGTYRAKASGEGTVQHFGPIKVKFICPKTDNSGRISVIKRLVVSPILKKEDPTFKSVREVFILDTKELSASETKKLRKPIDYSDISGSLKDLNKYDLDLVCAQEGLRIHMQHIGSVEMYRAEVQKQLLKAITKDQTPQPQAPSSDNLEGVAVSDGQEFQESL